MRPITPSEWDVAMEAGVTGALLQDSGSIKGGVQTLFPEMEPEQIDRLVEAWGSTYEDSLGEGTSERELSLVALFLGLAVGREAGRIEAQP